MLNHDSACQSMGNWMQGIEGAIADIYVECFPTNYEDGEHEIVDYDNDVQVVGPLLPTQNSVAVDAVQQQGVVHQVSEFVATQDHTSETSYMAENTNTCNTTHEEVLQPQDDESEDEDEDYLPIDADASDEDEEATQLRKKFKEFKKKFNAMEMPSLDDMTYDVGKTSRVVV